MARSLILTAVLALPFLGRSGAQVPDAAQIQRVTAEIADITGLEVKHPVPYEAISRAGWKKWVHDEIQASVKPAEIRAEELLLKKLGLVPQNFDLKSATVDLLGEQAAAVYDHRRKKMLFVDGATDDAMAEAVLVHELSHAVADQHFDMKRFLEKGPKSDEAQSARMAVVEGQAMWIMVESQLRKMGQSLKTSPSTLEMMLPAMGQMAAETYPIFSSAPLYLRETLLFPYSGGMMFQQAIYVRSGKESFAEILRKPPVSTQQILHPAKYIQNIEPTHPALPAVAARREYESLTEGSIGELDFRILLQQYTNLQDATKQAEKWRGSSLDLLEHKRDKHTVLRWSVEWDSPESAREFLRMYRKVLAGKWKKLELKEETETVLAGTGDDGGFRLVAEGAKVTGLEGLKPDAAAARPGL
ncbi:hypothetical protein [Paludibaculum fermentans]|uniref:Peptidase M48 domain-containing protein n=1 Tax=Paludibaculum fermentans TaxID=1473598 RepID=A0A7S7NT47_PALFE|nr:hypothetical protein [Paludibaculum fermentans]QOY89330.1 hypothetical protein IRI77_05070 [Paludibaculum fermentans]